MSALPSHNLASQDPHALLATLKNLEQRRSPLVNDRRFERLSIRGDAILQPAESTAGEPVSRRVQLRNISLTGVGFLSNLPFEPGSIWRLTFVEHQFAVGHQTLTLRHCQPIADGAYICGGQFCIEPGLLHILGIDPARTDGTPDEFVDSDAYLLHSDDR